MKTIRTVGVVGAGTMGAALAQKFAQEGFNVILADRALSFVEKGIVQIKTVFDQAIERRLFSHEQVNKFLSNLNGTEKLTDLKACDLIVEAIFENFEAKTELFRQLSEIVPDDTILASNTSSFSITELATAVKNPKRFVGLHYFYHAAKNRLVEIIPGENTSAQTLKTSQRFSVVSGKDAIVCADAYGFVVNRFFVPWLNEAVRLYEEQVASIEEIDLVCKETFGIGMGPFELMNATGVPVAYHAEKTLEVFGNLYVVAQALKNQAESMQRWPFEKAGEMNLQMVKPIAEKQIKERMMGVVFFICAQLLDEKVCSATDINRGARIGLQWKKGPIDLMKKTGEQQVAKMIHDIGALYQMPLPKSIGKNHWETSSVKLEINGVIAVITMDLPEQQNALSEETMTQLYDCFIQADEDPRIEIIYITGTGKAFVAGADIKFFVNKIKNNLIGDIETFTEFGQKVFRLIDHSKKKVIAVINGLALGGGLELALCADIILALPKAQLAFPETGIGIYPGLGGTQRSTQRIGEGLSKFLIHTGKTLSASEAEQIGLVDKVISYDEMFSLFEGNGILPQRSSVSLTSKWKAIEDFFENNHLANISNNKLSKNILSPEETEKIIKTIHQKAPIALRIADKLITEKRGCESELEHLHEIFSTSDALLGLTSIGKQVAYEGK